MIDNATLRVLSLVKVPSKGLTLFASQNSMNARYGDDPLQSISTLINPCCSGSLCITSEPSHHLQSLECVFVEV